MAYLGQKAHETTLTNRTTDTMTGDGSDTTLTLSVAPISVNNVSVFIDGVMQRPTTDYNVSGTTLTFAVAPHNTANVQAITGGGEHIGVPLAPITEDQLVDGVVTSAKLESGIQIPASKITGSISSSKLTGALPALDGTALTGMPLLGVGIDNVVVNPSPTTNPAGGVGTIHLNKTTGEMFVCTNATANNNIWFNVGEGSGDISNELPTNPTSTNNFPDIAISSSQTFTFSGATDADGSVTHYLVDNISSGNLTVSAGEVAAGSAHTFTTNGNVTSSVTFRVRSKDNDGAYSSGVTVTMDIINPIVTATGGNSFGTTGNYQYRIFTSSGTLNVSLAANTIEYLIVGGGGAGGAAPGGGGGGGGGYKTGTFTPSAGNYSIIVGQGGTSHPATPYNGPMGASEKGKDSVLSGTGASITAEGGGYGGGCLSASTGGHAYNQPGGNGGSGGGASWGYNGSKAGGTASAGNTGGTSGNGSTDWHWGGGGGGAGASGLNGTGGDGGAGGNGTSNSIGGSNPHGNGNNIFSTGGGGGGDSYIAGSGSGQVNGGSGGRGSPFTAALHGVVNTGAGGGGAPNNYQNSISGAGGSGIVIVKYKYQ